MTGASAWIQEGMLGEVICIDPTGARKLVMTGEWSDQLEHLFHKHQPETLEFAHTKLPKIVIPHVDQGISLSSEQPVTIANNQIKIGHYTSEHRWYLCSSPNESEFPYVILANDAGLAKWNECRQKCLELGKMDFGNQPWSESPVRFVFGFRLPIGGAVQWALPQNWTRRDGIILMEPNSAGTPPPKWSHLHIGGTAIAYPI